MPIKQLQHCCRSQQIDPTHWTWWTWHALPTYAVDCCARCRIIASQTRMLCSIHQTYVSTQMVVLIVPETTGELVDEQGAAALAVLRALGSPTTVAAVAAPPGAPPPRNAVEALKRRAAVKKHASVVLHTQGLADCGVYWLSGDIDQGALLRHIGSAPLVVPSWRSCRPSLVVEEVQAVDGLVGIRYDGLSFSSSTCCCCCDGGC